MVNLAGLVQGIVLVTFPAAITIFTSGYYDGLSSSHYGAMFLPQVVLAITTSLLGPRLAQRISTKRVYRLGLTTREVPAVLTGFLLEEAGEQRRCPGGAVGGDRTVVDPAANFSGDRCGDVGWLGGLVVHAPACLVAVEPVADVEVLLEVVAEREVQERPLTRGQFHRGR